MEETKTRINYFYRFILLISLAASLVISLCFGSILFALFAYPVVLTLLNVFFLFGAKPSEEKKMAGLKTEILTIVLGIVLSLLYGEVFDMTWADWSETLVNSEKHSPISPSAMPTVLLLALAALLAYTVLRLHPLLDLPPLLIVVCISALYLGAGLCVAWILQLYKEMPMLCLLPLNLILIFAKVIKELVLQWSKEHKEEEDAQAYSKRPLLLCLSRLFHKSGNWPWLAFLLALPLLGLFIAVLALFGQAPDSIVKAWTDTADWNLSQRVAPQNISFDEHYLCTVAAGGHKKVVKPLRLGKRHGHEVIVNRQLCIANAFEQILEEKTPRFHRAVRYLYDHSGYPLAKHIHSPYTADLIYFLMKPAEWLFLFVLYLCDKKPENRIAVQYLPKPLPKNS